MDVVNRGVTDARVVGRCDRVDGVEQEAPLRSRAEESRGTWELWAKICRVATLLWERICQWVDRLFGVVKAVVHEDSPEEVEEAFSSDLDLSSTSYVGRSKEQWELGLAILRGDCGTLRELLSSDSSVDIHDVYKGMNGLVWALHVHGDQLQPEMIEILLGMRDETGHIALQLNEEIPNFGETILMMAVRMGCHRLVDSLLRLKEDKKPAVVINQEIGGQTALDKAKSEPIRTLLNRFGAQSGVWGDIDEQIDPASSRLEYLRQYVESITQKSSGQPENVLTALRSSTSALIKKKGSLNEKYEQINTWLQELQRKYDLDRDGLIQLPPLFLPFNSDVSEKLNYLHTYIQAIASEGMDEYVNVVVKLKELTERIVHHNDLAVEQKYGNINALLSNFRNFVRNSHRQIWNGSNGNRLLNRLLENFRQVERLITYPNYKNSQFLERAQLLIAQWNAFTNTDQLTVSIENHEITGFSSSSEEVYKSSQLQFMEIVKQMKQTMDAYLLVTNGVSAVFSNEGEVEMAGFMDREWRSLVAEYPALGQVFQLVWSGMKWMNQEWKSLIAKDLELEPVAELVRSERQIQ